MVLTGGNYDGTVGKTAYWRNNGNLTFTDITASVGIPTNGTIVKGIGDFDQDGDTDFIATENKTMPPVIYLNDGHGDFTKKAGAISGVAAGSLDYSFWGTAVSTDFDNDGIPDIIMAGKYYLKVLRGTGGGNFAYMNSTWGILDTAAMSVDDGLCFGDIDGDGDLDIIGYNQTFPTRTLNVYRNDLPAKNWLNVRPVGLAGNTGAAGAKISIYAAGTNQLLWYEQVAHLRFPSGHELLRPGPNRTALRTRQSLDGRCRRGISPVWPRDTDEQRRRRIRQLMCSSRLRRNQRCPATTTKAPRSTAATSSYGARRWGRASHLMVVQMVREMGLSTKPTTTCGGLSLGSRFPLRVPAAQVWRRMYSRLAPNGVRTRACRMIENTTSR